MQILIDIPEEVKQKIDENLNSCDLDIYDCVMLATKNGTPLPKHSRLIDADELIKQAWDADDSKMGWIYVVEVGDIENAPTIIEATKETEE